MGGGSGVECCAEIRQHRGMAKHELPVLLVTASESDTATQNGFQAGATDFLQKPFAQSVLLARLESVLRLRELFTATVGRHKSNSVDLDLFDYKVHGGFVTVQPLNLVPLVGST